MGSKAIKEFTPQAERARKQLLFRLGNYKPRKGSWLRQWRLDHAITQSSLAALLGVSERSMIRWEQMEELPLLLVLALEDK